ncbi:MAG: sodium-dependent transporter [Bacteroidales bacterium]|nr:sodium-dependent transporter [Bacteroidales bacterium]MCF8390586.1 sodium-dependent transporter [Bacteroidales bacterium]
MPAGERDSFGSTIGVIAAAAGSAVGLGNIWRFPYVLGENGGGAFLLIYLGFILAIGFPVMLTEFTIGRRAQRNALGSFKKLAPGKPWYLIGLMGIVAAFLILAFYSTIAGWTLEYLYESITNGFSGKSSVELKNSFESFQAAPFRPVFWQFIFMFLTGYIVFSGVKNGIEKYTKVLMPILLLIIIIISVRSLTLEGSREGLIFLFKPDFSKISWSVVLDALGQAAFSLSIGMGTLITYGSYINKSNNLPRTAFQVSAIDTFIAILAGIMIFPAVFAFNIDPAEGSGLVFIVLPNIFQQMPGGYFFAILFFTLLAIAALTSTVSVLEVVVAYFSEELNLSRKKATIIGSVAISVVGIFATLSFGPLAKYKLLDKTIFGWFDYLSANILLPLGAIFIVLFAGWYLGRKNVLDEISNGGLLKIRIISVFMFIIKFLAPIAITAVFIYGLGLM